MDKCEALKEIVWDAVNNKRPSRTSYQRVLRAMDALGLIPEQQTKMMQTIWFNYVDAEGKPWPRYQKKAKASSMKD